MSGSDGYRTYETLADAGMKDWDLEAFENSTEVGAKELRGATRYKDYDEHGLAGVSHWMGANGADISDNGLIDRFNNWVNRKIQIGKKHEEYVKLLKDRPGRQQTLLTPYDEKQAQTLLGGGSTAGKTLLG